MAEAETMYRCARCGAPLEVTPETIVAVCSYCGYPNWLVEEARENIMIVPSKPEREVIGSAKRRIETDPDLKKIAGEIEVGRPQLIYVPFYFVKASARATYSGRIEVRYVVRTRRGDTWVSEHRTRVVEVSGDTGRVEKTYPIVARRAVSGFSVKMIGRYYLSKPAGARLLEQHKWTRSEATRVLSAEFTSKTAEAMGLDAICDYVRALAKRMMESSARAKVSGPVASTRVLSRRIRCLDRSVSSSDLTLLPLWIVPYYYRGTTYRLYVAGWNAAVIVAEEPMTAVHRLKYYALATASSGFLAGAALPALLHLGEDAAAKAAGALFLGGLVLNYYFSRKMLSPVRVETAVPGTGGGGSPAPSLSEIASSLTSDLKGVLGEAIGVDLEGFGERRDRR